MQRRCVRGCLLVLMAVATCLGQDRFDDITVEAEVTPFAAPGSGHGYTSLRLHVANTGTEAHTVTLDLGAGARWTFLNRVTGEVRVAPGGRGEVTLPVWAHMGTENRLTVTVDGRVFEPVSTPSLSVQYAHAAHTPLLTSHMLATAFEGSGPQAEQFVPARQKSSDWPDTWLDYSGFHLILLSAGEWDALRPGVRAALEVWRRNGGALVFDALPTVDGPDTTRALMYEDMQVYFQGFGATVVMGAPFDELSLDQLMQVNDAVSRDALSLSDMQDEDIQTKWFPVVAAQRVPLRLFFAVMLVLVFILGPLNLWYLTRRNQRILLLVTVPAISLAAAVVIFCFALFSDGVQTRLRRASVTLLDQRDKRATTLAHQAVYAPLTLSDGMHFGAETEVLPVGRDSRYRALDWRVDQHLTEGWVRARITAHFLQRQTETRRERVVFEPTSDGGVTALNGLGVDITWLRFVDADGRAWMTEHLAAGAQTTLTDAGYFCETEPADALNERLGAFWEPGVWFREVLDPRTRRQNPHTYLAEVPASPFIGPLPERVTTWQETSMIYGLVEAP